MLARQACAALTGPALSKALPHGQLRMLEGQTHDVDPGVLAPVLVEFFTSRSDQPDR